MKTLALDTSTVVCAAIAIDGQLVADGRVEDTRAHAEALMPLVVDLCRQAGITPGQLDDFVVGVGPGPFTGLRVGIATAHTLAALAGRTVRGYCSLDVLAQQVIAGQRPDGDFVCTIDARRGELYWARYGADGTRLDGPHVGPVGALPELPVTGPGTLAPVMQDGPVRDRVFGSTDLDAGALALANQQMPEAGIEPLYLRLPDATVPTARKSVLVPGQRSLAERRERRARARAAARGQVAQDRSTEEQASGEHS